MFGAVPTLTAAATATERMRLGTMVTSPNFRHPVTLAKDLAAIDDISCGRLIAGIGAAAPASMPPPWAGKPWSPRERADRLAEFVPLLDRLLSEPAVTHEGTYYSRARRAE